MMNMDHKETVKSGYNKIADRYLAERTQDSPDVHLLHDFIDLLSPKSKVLDAGCGAGIPIAKMLAENFDVSGVDFSDAQIELARKNVPNAHFLRADMTQLDFPDESLDGICSYYAIIHIPREEHVSLFESFYRMLKTGGVALLCLGTEDLVEDIEEDYLGTKMHWSHFDSNTNIKMLKESGFTIIWAKHVEDSTCEGAGHLFALVQKGAK
jgi:ubiquinone/menaquinone biosynthesis C-methylase UbiE